MQKGSQNKRQSIKYRLRQQNMQNIKYPTKAVQPAVHLSDKIRTLPQNSQKKIQKQLSSFNSFNSYRQVRGDGNCLYRSLAFAHFCHLKNSDFEKNFPFLQNIKLTVCAFESIPKPFQPFYEEEFLKDILKKNWSKTVDKYFLDCQNNYKRAYARLFGDNPYLDFIVVLYFRALIVIAFEKFNDEICDFLTGDQIFLVKTYSQESQGMVFSVCSKFLELKIQIYEIHNDNLNHYTYDGTPKKDSATSKIRWNKIRPVSVSVVSPQKNSVRYSQNPYSSKIRENQIPNFTPQLLKTFSLPIPQVINLLFYQQHYDILEQNNQLDEQKNDRTVKQKDYYSKIVQIKHQGNCIECSRNIQIDEISQLCNYCYERNQLQYKNLGTQKFIWQKCTSCHHTKQISNITLVCNRCKQEQIRIQNKKDNKDSLKVSKKSIFGQAGKKQNTSKIQNAKVQQNKNNNFVQSSEKQQDKTNKFLKIQGICYKCQKKKIINKYKICPQCKQSFQKIQNLQKIQSLQKKQNSEQKQCYKCGQSGVNLPQNDKNKNKIMCQSCKSSNKKQQ